MSKEICVSSTPHETRLAILEDDQLTEVYYERENEYTLAGSIYKGRVTRVLPGMQSAFVDLGLERDAFLYVTDFMEEQEDSSDFERIPGGGEEARSAQPRESQNRPPRPAQTANPEGESAPRRNGAPAGGQAPEGEFEDGTRKWRGRRGRRKGFRPGPGPGPAQGGGGQQANQEQGAPARVEAPRAFEPTDEPEITDKRPSVPFALPGESLSKYGGQAAPRTPAPVAPQPKANVILAKPSTLIETPIEWNGDGLLPGESISRYRGSATEAPAPSHHELEAADPVPQQEAIPAIEQPTPVVLEAAAYEEVIVPEPAVPEPEVVTEPEVEVQATIADEPLAAVEFEPEEASASYRVDPSAPSEFRFASPQSSVLEEEEPAAKAELDLPQPEDLRPEASHEPAFAASSPGLIEPETEFDELEDDLEDGPPVTGLVEEEEVTDEEEYDFTPLYVESEDHDLQELEEETLDQEVSVGSAISDMVRDAHIDQRTDSDASGLMVEEEEAEDELEEKFADGAEEEIRIRRRTGSSRGRAAGSPSA